MTIAPNKTRTGFTLIQVIATVAILALVVSIAFAALKNAKRDADNARLRGNAKVLNAAADRARVEGFADGAGLTGTDEQAALAWYLENDLLVKANEIKIAGLAVNNGVWTIESSDEGGLPSPSQEENQNPDPSLRPPAAPVVANVDFSEISVHLPTLPTGAQSLDLQISEDNVRWDTSASGLSGNSLYTFLGLPNGTTYYFRVAAVFATGSSVSQSIAGTTLPESARFPSTPDAPHSTDTTTTTVLLSIPEMPHQAARLVLLGLNNDQWIQLAEFRTGKTAFLHAGLTRDTTYQYKLAASNAWGTTESASATAKTRLNEVLGAPQAPTFENVGYHSVTIVAPSVPQGSDSLELQRSDNGGSTWSLLQADLTSGAKVTDSYLESTKSYAYRVVAVGAGGRKDGAVGVVTTPLDPALLPSAPDVVTLSNFTSHSITVTLPALPARAASMSIERSADGGATWQLAVAGRAGGAVHKNEGVTAGATYLYRAVATNPYGSTPGASVTADLTRLPAAPAAPTLSDVATSTLTVTAGSLPARTTSLKLERSGDGGITWTNLQSGLSAGSEYHDSRLTPGATYRYRLVAVNSFGSTYGASAPVFLGYSKTFVYSSGGDQNGVFYYLGTNGGISTFSSPFISGKLGITATSPDKNGGYPGDMVDRRYSDSSATGYRVQSLLPAAFTFDLGAGRSLILKQYAIHNPTTATAEVDVPKKWDVYGSNDGTNFTLIHTKNSTNQAVNAWSVYSANATSDYRYIRFAFRYAYRYTNIEEIELYGDLVDTSAPQAPELVTFSNVTQTSSMITMPAIPPGASSLELQNAPDAVTWSTLKTGLAGGEALNFTGSPTSYFRAVAVNSFGNTVGPASTPQTEMIPAGEGNSNENGGIFYQLATQFGTQEWQNPVATGYLGITLSGSSGFEASYLVDLGANEGSNTGNVVTTNAADSYIQFDVKDGNTAVVSKYTVRAATGSAFINMPSLGLLGSNDAVNWTVLDQHSGLSFTEGSTKVLTCNQSTASNAYRYFRISLMGLNGNGTHVLALSEAEFYGSFGRSSVTTTAPARPPTPTLADLAATSVTVMTPSAVPGASLLTIERSLNNTTWETLVSEASPSSGYPNTGLTSGQTYYYRIVATNIYGATPGTSVSFSPSNIVNRSLSAGGDQNGVFYYFGTSKGTAAWKNPIIEGEVQATASSTLQGSLDLLVDTVDNYIPFQTSHVSEGWVQFDLGGSNRLEASAFTYKTQINNPFGVPASLSIYGSDTGSNWRLLKTATGLGSTSGTWTTISIPSGVGSYRMFRVCMNGGSTNGDYSFGAHEMEFYGKLVAATPLAVPGTPVLSNLADTSLTVTTPSILSAGAVSYSIERSTNASSWVPVDTDLGTNVSVNDSGLAAGTIYYYRVVAKAANGQTKAGPMVDTAKTTQVNFTTGGETKGVFNYIGTNGLTTTYTNPYTSGKVGVTASSIASGTPANLFDRVNNEFYTNDAANSWVKFDLGTAQSLKLTGYVIRARKDPSHLPVSFKMEGSNDNSTWTTLDTQSGVSWPGTAGAYKNFPASGIGSYRFFRLTQTGPNSSGYNYFVLDDVELFGSLTNGTPVVDNNQTTQVNFTTGGETKGVFNYIGTSALTTTYTNPYGSGKVGVTASSVASGTPANLFDRVNNEFYTNDVPNSWVTFDLGTSLGLKLTGYVIRARKDPGHLPVSFKMEGSNDNSTWVTLDTQSGVSWPGTAGAYKNFPASGIGSYRFFRLTQTGPNSSGFNYFVLDDVELFGSLGAPGQTTPEQTTPAQTSGTINLDYAFDGDKNGLFYYLGTGGLTTGFTNPSTSGKLTTTASSGGGVSVVTNRVGDDFTSNDIAGSWVMHDLGAGKTLTLAGYSIRLRTGASGAAPANFVIQGSTNGSTWTNIDRRTSYSWPAVPGTWKTFTVGTPAGDYRFIRILSTGKDSSLTDKLCLGEMELYGTLKQ